MPVVGKKERIRSSNGRRNSIVSGNLPGFEAGSSHVEDPRGFGLGEKGDGSERYFVHDLRAQEGVKRSSSVVDIDRQGRPSCRRFCGGRFFSQNRGKRISSTSAEDARVCGG